MRVIGVLDDALGRQVRHAGFGTLVELARATDDGRLEAALAPEGGHVWVAVASGLVVDTVGDELNVAKERLEAQRRHVGRAPRGRVGKGVSRQQADHLLAEIAAIDLAVVVDEELNHETWDPGQGTHALHHGFTRIGLPGPALHAELLPVLDGDRSGTTAAGL